MQRHDYVQPADEISAGDHYYQAILGKSVRHDVNRDQLLERLSSKFPPQSRTILGALQRDTEGMPIRSAGPFYIDLDLDDDDLAGVISDFKKLLGKLVDAGVDLDQVRLAESGRRGFHLEIPQACFVGRIPADGTENLDGIYKEMAHAMAIDTIDFRVYDRNRQWRNFNVIRDNGAYKVPLTVSEALNMTPEIYHRLCAAPRPFPPLAAPTLASGLGLIFVKARDEAKAKALTPRDKAKASKGALLLQARCKLIGAPLPPSLLGVCSGALPAREGVGFNQLALQICITAAALDVDEDSLIALCSGLIQNHVSDGSRYNSPRKRDRELRQMHAYCAGKNYDLSIGGIRSILPASARCNDLRGL